MQIHQLIEQLLDLAVKNPTATVVNGAELIHDPSLDDSDALEPIVYQPIERVVYNAEDNTIIIDP